MVEQGTENPRVSGSIPLEATNDEEISLVISSFCLLEVIYEIIITKVKAGKLKNAIDEAKKNSNLMVADYPKDMLDTRSDEELVSSINSKENDKLEYLGAIIYGNTEEVDKITGKFQLWRID